MIGIGIALLLGFSLLLPAGDRCKEIATLTVECYKERLKRCKGLSMNEGLK